MSLEPGRWYPLSVVWLATVPEVAGVFEIGNLVRTVLLVSRGHGNLRGSLASVAARQEKLPPSAGGYYFRYHLTKDEENSLASRQAACRGRNRELPPPADYKPLEAVPDHATEAA